MPYTISDVAKKAGVSTATVSKVINDKMYVSPKTKEKVLRVMNELNYTPNVAASNLAKKSTKNILYADRFYNGLPFENPHMFNIICGAEHELTRRGFHLTLFNLDKDSRKIEQLIEDAITSKSADGMILNGALVTPQLERIMLNHDFPQICIGKPKFETILSWIDTNNSLSANLAVDHLLRCGCKKLAFMGGQKEDKIFIDRLKGFQLALQKNGITTPDGFITYNEPDIDTICHTASELLQRPDRPGGIICTNSLMTVGTMRAIELLRLKMPDDVALIAFDDYPYTPLLSPKPTVIEIDLFSLGVHAVSHLMRRMKDPATLIQTYTALPRLIQRETTIQSTCPPVSP